MADLKDLFGTGDPEEYRKKLAAALVQSGLDASPIKSATQGYARLAQALVGSMQMNDLASEAGKEKLEQANAMRGSAGLPALNGSSPDGDTPSFGQRLGNGLRSLFGGGDNAPPATSGRPGLPTLDTLPSTAVRSPTMPSPKMWGDQEAVNAGLYDPLPGQQRQAAASPPSMGRPSPMPPAPIGPVSQGPGGPLTDPFNGSPDGQPPPMAGLPAQAFNDRFGAAFPSGQPLGAPPPAPPAPPLPMMPAPNGPGSMGPMIGGPTPGQPGSPGGAMAQAAPMAPPSPQGPMGAPQGPQPPMPPQGGRPQGAPPIQPQLRQPPQIPPETLQKYDYLTRLGTKSGLQQAQLLIAPYQTPKDQTRPLTDPAERARAGIAPSDSNPYQIETETGKISAINPQPFNVNVNNQAESEFSKEAGKVQAKRFDELASEAPKARQMLSDLGVLRQLGSNIGTGKTAEVKAVLGPYADMLGVPINNLSDIQAYESIANRMAPSLRVPGTGSQSDFELRNFMKSLPSIGTTPEGNAMIDRTMTGLYNNKVTASEIGSSALTGEITRKEAEKRLRELPDPMEEWRAMNNKGKAPAGGAQPMPPQPGQTKIPRYNPATGNFE